MQSGKVLLLKVTSALLDAKTQPPTQVPSSLVQPDDEVVETDPLLSVSPEKVT